jgi:hypothetical protein
VIVVLLYDFLSIAPLFIVSTVADSDMLLCCAFFGRLKSSGSIRVERQMFLCAFAGTVELERSSIVKVEDL